MKPWLPLAAVVAVGALISGCSAGGGVPAEPPGSGTQRMDEAHDLAARAVGVPPSTEFASLGGGADGSGGVTVSGIRTTSPLSAGVACVGDGSVVLDVGGRPVALSCESRQTVVVRVDDAVVAGGSIAVTIREPGPQSSEWGVVVVEGTRTG